MNTKNISLFFSKTFIFSDLGEYSTGTSSFISNAKFNIPFIFKHVFWDSDFIAPSNIYFVLGDAKYYLIFPLLTICIFLGFIFSLCYFKKFNYQFFCNVFFMLFFAMIMSFVYEISPEGIQYTTLSTFRTYYLLIPLFFFLAVFFQFLFEKMAPRIGVFVTNFFVAFIALGLILYSFSLASVSFKKYGSFIDGAIFNYSTKAPSRDFTEEEVTKLVNLKSRLIETNNGVFFTNHAYIYKLAELISKKISNLNSVENAYIYLPEEKFTPSYFKMCCSLVAKPYLKGFLSIYLNGFNISNNYFTVGSTLRFNPSGKALYIVTSENEKSILLEQFKNLQEFKLN